MKLPITRIKNQELRIKTLILVLFFFLLFSIPQKTLAAFSGGINIGDHYHEFDQAAQASGGNGWVYVMMSPDNASLLTGWLNQYPNLQIIIRGHLPDQRGNSLTSESARRWANVFKDLPRSIYFIPVNEPNNPFESAGGIPAATVVSYINSLTAAIDNTVGAKAKVVLLSPAIDVYTLSDQGPSYINELGGWAFFQKFYGIALNLYGEYLGGNINLNAPLIKRGEGYREFLKSHFGADDTQAASARIFAVETGVKKVGENVKYQENTVEIVDYLNRMKSVWENDPNFVMYAVFSYDPAGDGSPWIYKAESVLKGMNLPGSGSPGQAIIPAVQDFQNEYQITKKANQRLLAKSIQEKIKEEGEKCSGGVRILGKCFGVSDKEKLAKETEQFQPVFVSYEKIVSQKTCGNIFECILDTIEDIFRTVVTKQVEEKPTGSLNVFRPQNLDFSQAKNQQTNNSVLGEETDPEKRVKSSYAFTLKMLLPKELSAGTTGPTVTPQLTATPVTTLPPSPTPTLPPTDGAALPDPSGSPSLKNLIMEVGQYYSVPPAVIAAISWIEGPQVWNDGDSQTIEYLKEGVKHPSFSYSILGVRFCRYNTVLASGPMQFTLGAWGGYKNSVRSAPGQQNRNPIICNLMDSFWAAGNKLKTDSGTRGSTSLVWDKEAVRLAGWHYYGQCGACDNNADWALTHDTNGRNAYACNRFKKNIGKAMSYCEYIWLYYQCNKNSSSASEFYSCIRGRRP